MEKPSSTAPLPFPAWSVGAVRAGRSLSATDLRQRGRGRHPEAPLGPAAVGAFSTDLRRGVAKLFKRTSDWHLRVVLLLILGGALLRIVSLRQPVTHDEALACTGFAARSFNTLLTDLSYPANQVLNTLLMRVSILLFGVHTWSIRLPALVAGILVMPLYYVFVRSLFNRYIAMLALALVAGSGCLIEHSAIGQGYSLSWLFHLAALMFGRHLVRTNNILSAVLMGLCCALGMWAVPTGIFAAITVYAWVFLQLSVTYRDSLDRRLAMLGFSGLLFLGVTFLLYAPVISTHGVMALFHHPTEGETNWTTFLATHQDRAFDLWAFINDTAATWISVLGFGGGLFAIYISSKFRVLVLALGIGAVPFAALLARVGPPWEWTYILYTLHLSSAIALFYGLKLLQERVFPKLSKRVRTVVASVLLFTGMGYLGMRGIADRIERFPDAAYAADWFKGILRPGDRVLVEHPWEAPVAFHLLVNGMDPAVLRADIARAPSLYILVGPGDGQTLQSVLAHHRYEGAPTELGRKVQDRPRLEIYRQR